MSVRQEDERKNNCPSRGLGLAAAAIGVGVGAALYYFFSKRQENPDAEGSTSEGWQCQQPQTLNASEDEYMTISDHSTSDTSILDDSSTVDLCNESSIVTIDGSEESVSTVNMSEYNSDNDADMTPDLSDIDESLESEETTDDENDSPSSDNESSSSTNSFEFTPSRNNSDQSHFTVNSSPNSDVSTDDWDVTNSSIGIPVNEYMFSSIPRLSSMFTMFRPTISSPTKNRERSWSLEECAICFEIMLKNQELMALPCTHNFHVACIGPWLQEQQTCPMCRKAAE